jgi:hypothetical protein
LAGRFKHAPLLGLTGSACLKALLYGLDRASRWALAAVTRRLQPQMLLMVLAAIAGQRRAVGRRHHLGRPPARAGQP